MPICIVTAFTLLPVPSSEIGGQLPPPAAARKDLIQAYQDLTKVLEKETDSRANAPKGLFSEFEIDMFRSLLSVVRHDLALVQNETIEERLRHAKLPVEIWQRHWERVRKLRASGAASPDEEDIVLNQLRSYRYFCADMQGQEREAAEQLDLIIEQSEKRLANMKIMFQKKAVSEAEVDRERWRLEMACYAKSQFEKDSAGSVRHLRAAVAIEENNVQRIVKARENRAASQLEELVARDLLTLSRIHLAVVEKNNDELTKQLDLQVTLRMKLLEAATYLNVSDVELSFHKLGLAMARDRQARNRSELALTYEHPSAHLRR